MITLRKSEDRGQNRESWLESKHTFSFHTYYDPNYMGFRDLRVINQDRVAPSRGFDLHPHRDMEIFSLVLSGALEHRDNLGNREVIGPYQLQKITAGTGVLHSEFNPSADQEVHFLQIWILPEREGLDPGYEIKDFSSAPRGRLTPLLNPDGSGGAARLRQNATVYLGRFPARTVDTYLLAAGRYAWLQMISGTLQANGVALGPGDGAAVSDERQLQLMASEDTEFLLFDLR